MKIYLINLDRSPDRLKRFMEENAAVADRVERIQALDGRDLSPEAIEKFRSMRRRSTILGVGDIACARSHRLAWQRFVDSGEPWAFVAEDDLLIAPGSERFFANTNWIPPDADVVKAETYLRPTRIGRPLSNQVYGHSLARLQMTHMGAGGYFLNAPTAVYLLEYSRTVCEPADQILFGESLDVFDKLKIYQIDPAIGIQNMFLDEDNGMGKHTSLRSSINDELGGMVRKQSVKPTGWAKVQRELSRPFTRMAARVRTICIALTTRVVPFHTNPKK